MGFLIVVVFLVSLDLAMRTTATGTQPLVEDFTFQRESRTRSKKSKVLSVSKLGLVQPLETGSLSRARVAPVPLPLRKPERVYKVPNGKGAKANPASQKRMAQQRERSRSRCAKRAEVEIGTTRARSGRMAEPQLQSTLTCPHRGHQATETMPTDACAAVYDCKGCGRH